MTENKINPVSGDRQAMPSRNVTVTLPASAVAHIEHMSEMICQPLEECLASLVYLDEMFLEATGNDEHILNWLDGVRHLTEQRMEVVS